MFTNYSLTLKDDTAEGTNVSLFLDLNEYYAFADGDYDYAFKVVSKASSGVINIAWVQLEATPTLKPVTLPVTVTDIKRGFSSSNYAIYGINNMRRGYLDVDSIVFDLFYRKIARWTWNGGTHFAQHEEDPTKFVDFFFFNKRPSTRQPYAERTGGAVDNVDSSWRNSTESSNPTSIKHMPYLSFQPISVTPTPDELYRVEEFYRYINNVPTGLFDDYDNIEIYQPPQLYEFSYQITAVTDSWKDCRILQSHLINSLIPTDRGERYVTFPSGMTHTVTVEPSDITPLEDEGVFETTVTFIFKLPLIDRYPELTYSWVTGIIDLEGAVTITNDVENQLGAELTIGFESADQWGSSGDVDW